MSSRRETEKRKNSRSPAEHRHGEGGSRGHKIQVCTYLCFGNNRFRSVPLIAESTESAESAPIQHTNY